MTFDDWAAQQGYYQNDNGSYSMFVDDGEGGLARKPAPSLDVLRAMYFAAQNPTVPPGFYGSISYDAGSDGGSSGGLVYTPNPTVTIGGHVLDVPSAGQPAMTQADVIAMLQGAGVDYTMGPGGVPLVDPNNAAYQALRARLRAQGGSWLDKALQLGFTVVLPAVAAAGIAAGLSGVFAAPAAAPAASVPDPWAAEQAAFGSSSAAPAVNASLAPVLDAPTFSLPPVPDVPSLPLPAAPAPTVVTDMPVALDSSGVWTGSTTAEDLAFGSASAAPAVNASLAPVLGSSLLDAAAGAVPQVVKDVAGVAVTAATPGLVKAGLNALLPYTDTRVTPVSTGAPAPRLTSGGYMFLALMAGVGFVAFNKWG